MSEITDTEGLTKQEIRVLELKLRKLALEKEIAELEETTNAELTEWTD